MCPCGFPDSALAHLRGVGGSELAQSGSWLSPSAPAQGSRWRTRDTDVGISLGAVFVHGWAPFHNRGCGIKDAAFSEGKRDPSSALCHARSSETDQMLQWHAALPGQVSPTCAHLSLTGSCQHPLPQQGAQLSRNKSQDSSSLLGEAVVESGEPAASTCHCHNVQEALCA